jgi:hypothetical protein
MNPQPLHRPYIGITLYVDDYAKVQGLLPTPSYTDRLQGHNYQKIILIYAIEGYITSPSQYRWISNIKLGLEKYLCVPFTYEEDYHITHETDMTTTLYTIGELSKAFKAPIIIYPKIMHPPTKKELYRDLCRYGKRLIHQKCFTKEAMTATALLMNKRLFDKYSNRDLHKKVLGAYIFIDENRENFPVKLDEVKLKEAHTKGAKITNKKQTAETKAKIFELLKDDVYIKPNGKVNKTLLADDLGMNRRTLDKYLKDYSYG